MIKTVTITLFLLVYLTFQQQNQAPGILQTKRIAFGGSNAMVFNSSSASFALTFQRTFSSTPRIGLSVYTMDFEYSPTFSCKVTNNTSPTSTVLRVTTSNVGQNNQLFLMYMATDHPLIGIFMPAPLITDQLNLRLQRNNQTFRFNYKSGIITSSSVANIRVSVFLTGISMTSELTNNGYSINRTFFRMVANKQAQIPFYTIVVQVQSSFGDVTISTVQYTVVYFDTTTMDSTAGPNARYLMDSGVAGFRGFGGTATPTSQASTLPFLNDPTASYQGNFIFYGISYINCAGGPSIVLSGYPTIYNNSNNNQFILNAQTWKLTYIQQASYEYIQYQTLKCNLPLSNCDSNCNTSPVPHYIVNGICHFCHYSCLTCNQVASTSACDTCHSTRQLNIATQLCDCISGYYDPFRNNYTCFSCFPCQTCAPNSKLCLTCNSNQNLIINTVLSTCECRPGFYPNFVINSTNLDTTQPCLPCPQHCLLCTNSTFCLACDLTTYLTQGQCTKVCASNQIFNSTNGNGSNATCSGYGNSLFDQSGRLGYDFTYQTQHSVINFTLTFSQPSLGFYYYQNETSYSASNSASNQSNNQGNQFYFDDGNQNIDGYQSQTAQQVAPSAPIAALGNASQSSNFLVPFDFSLIKISDLNGSYLGISEQYYYFIVYQQYQLSSGIHSKYNDMFGIPYGKVNLTASPPVQNPQFVDALSKNLVVTIGNDTVQPKIVAASGNQFYVTSALSRSYFGQTATLSLKNQGLVRSGAVASQLGSVGHPVYIYVCTIPSDVSLANSLYDSNKIIVGVLWGLGKYPMFIGFGWIFMPLMLVLMSIMNLNYIDTQRPLNLDLFLASFADFRNPSILYNPLRDDMDNSIFTHPNIYQNIHAFNRFDRGIDFMKNCFQFFFVPFLAVCLYCLIVGFNKLLNKACKKDIPLISQYIYPRFPLLIGAYTLVQALPITFFFFAQLNDTRYKHGNAVNASYPVFNVAMSYLAFFLTIAIPLALMAYIYYVINKKDHQVNSGSQLILMFTTLIQAYKPDQEDQYVPIADPLWTQRHETIAFGFGLTVFYLFIAYGFFTSFFYNNHAWQLAGLITVTTLFGFFAFVNSTFTSVIIKAFWIVFSLLMLAFLLLLAALGSNVTTSPCGLENLGYLAIGFLYAMIIMALIASLFLLWLVLFHLYSEYCKGKPFITDYDKVKAPLQQGEVQRKKSMREHTQKSRLSKSQFSQYNGSRANIGPGYVQPTGQQNMQTSNRLRQEQIEQDMDDNVQIVRQKLKYDRQDQDNGDFIFVTERSNRQYRFDQEQGRHLYGFPRLFVDPTGQITDGEKRFIHRYQEQPIQMDTFKPRANKPFNTFAPEENQDQENNVHLQRRRFAQEQQLGQRQAQNQVDVKVINRYIYNGQQYQKVRDLNNGQMLVRNIRTGQTIKLIEANMQPLPNQAIQNQLQPQQLQQQQQQQQKAIVNMIRKPQQKTEIISHDLSSQISQNKIQYAKNHKFKYNNEEYTKLGDEGQLVRLYNNQTKKLQKVTQQEYLNRLIQSLNDRVHLNGKDYNVMKEEDGYYHLVEMYNPANQISVGNSHLAQIRNQNQNYIRSQLYGNILGNRDTKYKYDGGQQQANMIINRVVSNQYQQDANNRLQQEINQFRQDSDNRFKQEANQYRQQVNQYRHESPNNIYRQEVTSHQYLNQAQTQPPSASYANNLLLLQSKATKEPNISTSKRQVIIKQEQNNGQVRTSHQQIRSSQQEIKSSQESINEYRAYKPPSSNQYIQMQNIRQEYQQPANANIVTTYTQRIEEKQPQIKKQQIQIVEQQLDPDTIQYILATSPGPFQMYVMGAHQVRQVNDEDVYQRNQALQRKILYGKDVMSYMSEMQQKIPGCIIFMVDMSNQEEYRIN